MRVSPAQRLIEFAAYYEQRQVNAHPMNIEPPKYDEQTLREALGQLEALKRLIFTMLSNANQIPQANRPNPTRPYNTP